MEQDQREQERQRRRQQALEEYNTIVSYDISSGLQKHEQKQTKQKKRFLRLRNIITAAVIILTAICYFYMGKQFSDKEAANKALRRELTLNLEKTEQLEQELKEKLAESEKSASAETETVVSTAEPQPAGQEQFTAVYPLTGSCVIIRSYGSYTDEYGGTVFFPGMELGTDEDTSVIAAADGTVVFAGEDDLTGLTVRIDHGNGYLSYYCYNRKIMVTPGQTVTSGQVIALPGEADAQDMSHMEFRIMLDGSYINPEDVLEIKG